MQLIAYGFMGAIMVSWKNYVGAVKPLLSNPISGSARNIAQKPVFTSIVLLALQDLSTFSSKKIQPRLRKATRLGVQVLGVPNFLGGKVMKWGTTVFIVGLNELLENQSIVSFAKRQTNLFTNGLIKVVNTNATCLIGNVYVLNVI